MVYRHVVVNEDLSEFLNDGSWRRGYNVNRCVDVRPLLFTSTLSCHVFLIFRVYHHCRTSLPLLQDELEQEKEELKMSLQWQKISSKKVLVHKYHYNFLLLFLFFYFVLFFLLL